MPRRLQVRVAIGLIPISLIVAAFLLMLQSNVAAQILPSPTPCVTTIPAAPTFKPNGGKPPITTRAIAKSGKSIKNERQSLSRDGREATAGIGNIGKTTGTQQAQDEIVKDGNGLGGGANGQLASILMKGPIAGVVEFIFNGPMVTM